ncbi:MAG: TonB-dependent receptor [Cyclobacteriaceae bacterium]
MKKIYFLLIILIQFQIASAQSSGSLKGIVHTSDGQPAQDVNLVLKGSGKGATTNHLGEYAIVNIKPGKFTLVISFVGHKTLEHEVEVSSGVETIVPEIILNESAEQLAEIVIRGSKINSFDNKESEYVSKIPLKKMENSQVYSSITKELLKEQLVFSIDDAVKNSPGVQKMWEATGRSGDGGAYYNARGFVLQSQLRNGIAGNVTSRIDAANLERVEVIKGPSATLFGSTLTSYGGLINRVTKKPFERPAGEVTLSSGSFGFSRVSTDVNAPLTEKKDILFRLNAAYQNEGSFQDYGFSNSLAIAPSLTYKMNDKLTLQLDAEIYSGKNSSKQMIFFYYPAAQLGATRADQLGIDYNRAYSTNSIYQTSANTNLFGQLTYRISNSWTSQTNFTSTRSFSNGPGAYFYVVPNSVVTGNSADTGADYLVRTDQSTSNNVMQVTEVQQNFLGDFNLANMRHRFIGGIDLFYQNSNQLFYGVDPFDIIKKNGVIPQYENFNSDKLDSALQNGSPWKYPYSYKQARSVHTLQMQSIY